LAPVYPSITIGVVQCTVIKRWRIVIRGQI